MLSSLCLALALLTAAPPVWLEAEAEATVTGLVDRLDETAPDFGRMATGDAGGQVFLRLMPEAKLTYPARDIAAGEYACWARTFPIDGRRVTLSLDGQEIGSSRGGPNNVVLTWSRLGTVKLAAGPHTLALSAAAGNSRPAYVDAILLTPSLTALPLGKTLDDVLEPGDPSHRARETFDDLPLDSVPPRWRSGARDDQWLKVVDESDRHCLRVHNGTAQRLHLLLAAAVTPGEARQLRVTFKARRYGITESVIVEIPGVGSWTPMLRKSWTDYERTFLVPADVPGPFCLQLTSRGGGDTLLDDVVLEAPEQPVSPFETGRFLTPWSLSREGRLFELERYVVNQDAVTESDRDGDGKWSLIRVDRDHNAQMFSRGTVLKSDSANSPALTLKLTDLAPGPYTAWLGETGRPVTVRLAGHEPAAADGASQTKLGRVEITDGTLELTVQQTAPDSANPGPVYLDYVTLLPVENEAYTSVPAPTWPATAKDGVERASAGFDLRRAGVAGGGVALPAGALGDPSHARVLSAGREVPSQTKVLCRWPDGSVKWLFVVAGPLPAGQGTLEYGAQVRPQAVSDPVRVTAGKALVVDAGLAQLSCDGQGLWSSLRLNQVELGRLTGELTLADGTVLRPTEVKATIVERGPVRVQVRLDGTYANDDRRPFGLQLLVTLERQSDAVGLEHTVITLGPAPSEKLQSLQLRLATPGGKLSCPEAEQTADRLRLRQDGTNPWAMPDGASYRLQLDDRELTGERARGVIRHGKLQLAVDDFAQQWPIALSGEPNSLTAELWPADAAEGRFTAHRGMAKTHVLRLSLGDNEEPVVDWLRFDPAALRASGAWGHLTAGDESTTVYDEAVEAAYDDDVNGRSGYGLENWGDIYQGGYVRGAKTWSNQEWDLVQNWLVSYVRLGDLRYLDYADAAARHYADVDCVHAGPASILGGARTHVHTSLIGHQLEGPNTAHAGWVEGLLNHSYLTGCERSRQAALAIGDWIVRTCPACDEYSPSGPPYPLAQNRPAGWPLTTLCLLYQQSQKPEYLTTARRIVDYMHRCQMPGRGCWEAMTPHEYPWRGGCVFAFTNFRGLKLFAEITGDEQAERDRELAGRWLLGELWRPHDRYLYEQCPAHEPGVNVGFLQWGSLADLTELTGDPLYLQVALDGLAERLGNPAQLARDMARCQWGNGTLQQGGQMLGLAAELGLQRPAEVMLSTPDKVELTAGGEAVWEVKLHNGLTKPLTELRGTVLIRGDWQATLTACPTTLAAGAEATLRIKLQTPPPLEIVARDNDTAYLHLGLEFKLDGQPGAARTVTRGVVK